MRPRRGNLANELACLHRNRVLAGYFSEIFTHLSKHNDNDSIEWSMIPDLAPFSGALIKDSKRKLR